MISQSGKKYWAKDQAVDEGDRVNKTEGRREKPSLSPPLSLFLVYTTCPLSFEAAQPGHPVEHKSGVLDLSAVP